MWLHLVAVAWVLATILWFFTTNCNVVVCMLLSNMSRWLFDCFPWANLLTRTVTLILHDPFLTCHSLLLASSTHQCLALTWLWLPMAPLSFFLMKKIVSCSLLLCIQEEIVFESLAEKEHFLNFAFSLKSFVWCWIVLLLAWLFMVRSTHAFSSLSALFDIFCSLVHHNISRLLLLGNSLSSSSSVEAKCLLLLVAWTSSFCCQIAIGPCDIHLVDSKTAFVVPSLAWMQTDACPNFILNADSLSTVTVCHWSLLS